MSETFVLGYWGIRGRGQVARLLLAYTGATWRENKYYSQEEWKGIGKDQSSLGIPFPNLPYLIHDDLKISESRAIMKYIIQNSSAKQLLGKNLKDQAYVENIVGLISQVLSKTIELIFDIQGFQSRFGEVKTFVKTKLEYLQQFCEGKDFAIEYLSWADFMIAETSYYIQKVFPELYSKLACLGKIRRNIQSLAEIKQYYERKDAVKGPFLPPIGKIKF